MPVGQSYEVKLDLFEGPLDLLLYLVQRSEVDITEISVSAISSQYLEYLDLMHDLNIDVASEYLHMAATLLRIKARELLPEVPAEAMEEQEGIYNREQLIQQLLEYKKYKQAAFSLRTFEGEQAGAYGRGSAEQMEVAASATDELLPGTVSIFDLLTAFRRILEKAKEADPQHVVHMDNVRIDDRIEHILTMLADRGETRFEDLFTDDLRRIVIAVTFMAILELVKMQEIWLRQENNLTSIFVSAREKSTRDPL